MAPERLEVQLPTVPGDGHFHDFRRAFVDRRDPHVPLDLLDDIRPGVSVAAVGLDRRVGGRIACFGGEVLRDRTLGVHRAVVAEAAVEFVGRVLHERPGRLEAHRVRDDEFVGEALLLRQWPAALFALSGVGDRPIEGLPPTAEAERGDHQAGVPEDLLGLHEPLARLVADEVVRGNRHLVEEEGRGVREAQAVLVLGRPGGEAGGVLGDDKPGRALRGLRENRREIGNRAVGNPLFAPIEDVCRDLAVVVCHRCRGGRHRPEVAAGFGFGRAVSEHDALLGDGSEPFLLLLLGGADDDRVGPEEGGEDGGGQPDVLARHRFTHEVGVHRAAVHTAVGLGDEDELDAEGHRVRHGAHDVLGASILMVEVELQLWGQGLVDEVVEGLDHHFAGGLVAADAAYVTGGGWVSHL